MGKARELNEQFQSVFSPRKPLPLKSLCNKALNFINPSGKPVETPSMPPIETTEDGVLKILLKITPHKEAGPDKIIPNVLRELVEVIIPAITRINRASFEQGKTSDIWKKANITPVFKEGEKYRAANY